MARQPGPEVAIQLKTTQGTLKARDKKIKVCHPVIATASAMAAGVVAVVVGKSSTNLMFICKFFQMLYICHMYRWHLQVVYIFIVVCHI
jgi:hypothetical protein